MKQVSLYVPCYNAEKHIARCIEGVLRQIYPVDEILIIDDGCRDNTIEIASRYPVRVVRHDQNKGLAAARNTGFRSARNEFVAALDVDCVPEPDWLEKLMISFDDEKIVGAGGRLVETVLDSIADRWRKAHMTQDWGNNKVVNPIFMFGNNSVIRKSAVVEVGYYNERLRTNAEDYDISLRLRAKGYDFIYEPNAVVKHFRRDNVSSILDTAWRYTCFAYFQEITLNTTLKSIYSEFVWTWRFLKQTWHGKNYELLWLDILSLIYKSYRDLRLFLRYKLGAIKNSRKKE